MSRIRNLFRAAFDRPPRQNVRPLRPRLSCEAMEARDVPAAFSFTLVRGPGFDHGAGLFTAPTEDVDPGEATQAIELTDLVVNVNGTTFDTFDTTPTANYEYGVFQGVTFDVADSAIPSGFPYADVRMDNGTATGDEAYQVGATMSLAFDDPVNPTAVTFSGTLNGDAVTGTGTLAAAVDLSNRSFSVGLSAVTMTIGSQTYTGTSLEVAAVWGDSGGPGQMWAVFASPPGAEYTEVSIGFGLSANGLLAYAHDLHTATPVYDETDTQATFDFGNGIVGAFSYTVPWDDVDPTEATQTVPLVGTVLNLLGMNFSGSDFDATPTATFEDGELSGVSFSLSSIFQGFTFSGISVANGVVTAIEAISNTTLTTPILAEVAVPTATIFFVRNVMSTSDAFMGNVERVKVRVEVGDIQYSYNGAVVNGQKVGEAVDVVVASMKAAGLKASATGDRRGIIVLGQSATVGAGGGALPPTIVKAGIYFEADVGPIDQSIGVALSDGSKQLIYNSITGTWNEKPPRQ